VAEEREACEAEQRDVFVVQDFGGQQCVCCAARDKKTWLKQLIRGVLWVRVDGPSCLVVVGL